MGTFQLVLLFCSSVIIASGQNKHEGMAAEQPKDFYIRQMAGAILTDCKTLESVLDHKVPLPFYDKDYNMTFFSLFFTFWIRFNLSQDKNTTAIEKIAERNKNSKHFADQTEVFISFVPKGDILDDLRVVLNVVKKANEIYPGTVSTLILNYGFLLLDPHSVLLVNQDIKRVAGEMALRDQKLKLVIQLDSLHCVNRKEYLGLLDINGVYLLLVPQENSKFDAGNDMLLAIPNVACERTMKDAWDKWGIQIIPLGQNIPLVINLNEEYFNFDVAFINSLVKFYTSVSQMDMIPFSAKLFANTDKKIKLSKLGINNFDEWIEQPLQFSKSNLGAIIGIQNATRLLASSTLSNFRKIAINDKFVDTTGVNKFMITLLSNSNFTDELQTPLEIALFVNVEKDNFEIVKEQMTNAVSVATAGNAYSHGTIRSIVLDWTFCMGALNCGGFDLENDQCFYFSMFGRMMGFLLHSTSLLTFENPDDEPIVGYVIDERFLTKIISLSGSNCTTRKKRSFEDESSKLMIVCKSVLASKEIEEKGVERSVTTVLEELNRCAVLASHMPFAKHIAYHVNVVGCKDSGDLSQLAGYASMLEKLSKWAAGAKKVLYVDAGVEDETHCGLTQQVSSQNSCACGWWKEIKSGSSTILIDKKRLALKLHKGNVVPSSSPVRSMVLEEMLPYILVPAVFITITVTSLATLLVLRYRSKDIISKQEVSEFVYGSRRKNSENQDGRDSTVEGEPFNAKKYELAPSSFIIDRSHCLGAGEFGKVFRGAIMRMDAQVEAAVKVAIIPFSVKGHGYYLAVKGLISEIKVLSFLGEHQHIVTLLGAYTAKLRKGNIAVFLELCPLGSLDKFLRSYKPQKNTANDDETNSRRYVGSRVSTASEDQVTVIEMKSFVLDSEMANCLQRWAGEIACGMEFISAKKLVHADLATRNILLTADKIAKISDFGLSRRLYDYSEYVKNSQCPLPWRWMAPESLRRSIFTEKSDVWAFGVTLWELYTLGDEPYPGLTWNPNFPAMVERGLRLNEPRYISGRIYEIMRNCWDKNPAARPSFAQLNSELNNQ